MKMPQLPEVKAAFWPFNGGLDQMTPPLSLPAGAMRVGMNVEIGVNGGYGRLGGFERFSGKAKPSAATYSTLTATITGALVLGDVLTDNAGTSFGTVIVIEDEFVVLTLITGTFSTGNVKVGGVTVGTCVGAQVQGGATTPALAATYKNLAADIYRALIAVVPGSGSILGVNQYNGKVYAFRNNAGATAAVMHEASTSGWTAVALGRELAYTSGGTYEIAVGNTITGATSGATAVITAISLSSGTFAAGTAAGRLTFASQTGTFQSENLNVGANLNVATIAGNSSAIALSPGGRYEFVNHNFGGLAGAKKMYGVDGVNRGFEFNGTAFMPIATGMATDTPKYLTIHKQQLFFAFAGSAQHSAIGNPHSFAPIFGASELACGDLITGFTNLAGSETAGALCIKTSNRTLVLYGNDVDDWNLVPFSDEVGGRDYTQQYITQGICLDTQGVTLLSATQNYGNFNSGVASDKIAKFLEPLIDTSTASCIVRKKNQYRLFFENGQGVYVTFKGNKIMGMTTVDLPQVVTCISSMEGLSGREEIYFGSDDGYVYQMDIGTSFDGAAIDWAFQLAYNHLGSPRQLKSYRAIVTESTGTGYCEFSLSFEIGYGSTEYEAFAATTCTAQLAEANWDSFVWDEFFWDGRNLVPTENDLGGTAENIALTYSGSSDEFPPFTLNGSIIHYSPRRMMRLRG